MCVCASLTWLKPNMCSWLKIKQEGQTAGFGYPCFHQGNPFWNSFCVLSHRHVKHWGMCCLSGWRTYKFHRSQGIGQQPTCLAKVTQVARKTMPLIFLKQRLQVLFVYEARILYSLGYKPKKSSFWIQKAARVERSPGVSFEEVPE